MLDLASNEGFVRRGKSLASGAGETTVSVQTVDLN